MLSRPPRSTRIYSLCSYTTLFRAADGGSGSLFRYAVSHSAADLRARRKSTYYSTEMSEALSSIAGDGKRYAFVGVPCFVKAIRSEEHTSELQSLMRISYAVFCLKKNN